MLTDTLNAPLMLLVEDDNGSTVTRRADIVLIVDDEEIVREVCSEMFREFGFEPLTADNGVEALQIFRNQGDRIVLVLLDYSMPGMDGVAVFRALRKEWPDIPVMLASGYCEEEVAVRFKEFGLNGFIQKPFSLKCLENEVQRVLKSEAFSGAR